MGHAVQVLDANISLVQWKVAKTKKRLGIKNDSEILLCWSKKIVELAKALALRLKANVGLKWAINF